MTGPPDGAAAELTAPDDEYPRRLARVRDRMRSGSLAALLVTDPANLYYLTGYDAWSFYTPQCLVVPADGDPVCFLRAMDANGARFAGTITPDRVEGYPESLVHQPDRHPFDWIAGRIRARELLGPEPRPVLAVEGDAHFFPVRGYLALAAGLPGCRLVDSGELVNWTRLVKSDHERALLRRAGVIAGRAMRTALEAVRPGRRQCDAAAEILAAQAVGTPEFGGDYPAITPMLPTGSAAGTPHLTWSERPFRRGEATTVELAGTYRRYHAPLARTIALGPPDPRLARTADVVGEGMALLLDRLRPGVTGGELHAGFDEHLRRHGMRKESRIGYSIGIGYPPDWGERTVSLRAAEPTPLRPGMAFHLILGMWMDGWGYELSEPVLVGEQGAERLADLPPELTVRL
jgi:ectoine hydrolase